MEWIHWLLLILDGALALAVAGHALLHKRDPRAALGWATVCLAFPPLGPILYFLFGFNRVRTRAQKLSLPDGPDTADEASDTSHHGTAPFEDASLPQGWRDVIRVSEALTGHRPSAGNRIAIFHNGEEAYPAMLAAIDRARDSVFLSTYIFESNRTGRTFIERLAEASRRGVDVRVLLDGVGEWYSLPRAGNLLRKAGVRMARFLPPRIIPPSFSINLRNHRKVLVVDGRSVFLGGMNIGDRHLAQDTSKRTRIVDTHFRVEGPVVVRIEQAFLHDWHFCTGETLKGSGELPGPAGDAVCQVVLDGPDEDLDKLGMILVTAVSEAQERVWIMTPYFLPPRDLIGALQTAALKGVDVRIILPGRNNLPFVHWATRNMLWELLRRQVRVYYQPPPFVHSKLLIVDDFYAQVGSANIDPRSLRLNFELTLEIYSPSIAASIAAHMAESLARAKEFGLDDLERRSLPARLRDGLAWVLSPYL